MRRLVTSRVVSSAIALAIVLTLAAPHDAGAQTSSGGFVGQPAYSADGFAQTVFRGGTVSDLLAAARTAGAGGAWLQDGSGRYYLLVVDAPPFVAAPAQAAYPDGFSIPIAVTLVRAPRPEPVPSERIVPSPVERAEVVAATSLPAQYFVQATFGLPNGCHTFRGVETRREGDVITITATNNVATNVACTQVYGYVDRNVALGSDFASGRTYTVHINDVTRTFRVP